MLVIFLADILKNPPLSLSKILAKTEGESKNGKHNQSMLQSSETSAALAQFPIIP